MLAPALTGTNCASSDNCTKDFPSSGSNNEPLYQGLFKGPTRLCKKRSSKRSLHTLNFKHNTAMEGISMDSWEMSEWIKEALGRKTHGTIGGSPPNSTGPLGTTRSGQKVQDSFPELNEVKELHAHIVESGKMIQTFEKNILIDMYVKGGSMKDAHHVFGNVPNHNVVSWNMMILGYAKQEEGGLALELYAQMRQEGIIPTDRTFVATLKACSSLAAQEEGKQVDGKLVKIRCLEKGSAIHSHVVEGGFESNIFVGNILVDMYTKCGSMEDAQHVFENLHSRDVVSWTAMILGYAQKEEGAKALELYACMYQEAVIPNHRTFVAALKACSSLAAVEEGKQVDGIIARKDCLEKGRAIHFQAVKSGFESDVFVGSILVDMYAKCGSMEDARHVFDELPHRNVVSWNTLITRHAQKEEGALALELYTQMHKEGMQPNDQTFVAALKACSSMALEEAKHVDGIIIRIGCLQKGKAVHSQAVKSGFDTDVKVGNTLVDMYAKCGSLEDAGHVFDKMPNRNTVSWTALILGYVQKEECALGLQLYAQMHQKGVQPSDRTFVGVLKACSALAAHEEGRQIDGKCVKMGCLEKGRTLHSQIMKFGSVSDVFVGTTLVDMYVNCGSMEDARHVFDDLPYRNVVSWNAMILGYAEQDKNEEAFKLHMQMQEQGPLPNSVTFSSILKACGNTAALETGKELHAQICNLGLETTAIVVNTLIDMYAKCGSMVDAQKLFDALYTKDFVTWNVMIAGYACQGECEPVFHLFEGMMQEGIQPNGITLLSVLNVCSHAGLLDKGHIYFQAMRKVYCITPNIEHYTCMIDLLGRAGQVEAAMAMVESMPYQPDVVSWVALLGACCKWNHVEVGRCAFEHVVRLDEKNVAAYVLMANVYTHMLTWEACDKC